MPLAAKPVALFAGAGVGSCLCHKPSRTCPLAAGLGLRQIGSPTSSPRFLDPQTALGGLVAVRKLGPADSSVRVPRPACPAVHSTPRRQRQAHGRTSRPSHTDTPQPGLPPQPGACLLTPTCPSQRSQRPGLVQRRCWHRVSRRQNQRRASTPAKRDRGGNHRPALKATHDVAPAWNIRAFAAKRRMVLGPVPLSPPLSPLAVVHDADASALASSRFVTISFINSRSRSVATWKRQYFPPSMGLTSSGLLALAFSVFASSSLAA